MKKEYITPQSEVVELETTAILNASDPTVDEKNPAESLDDLP